MGDSLRTRVIDALRFARAQVRRLIEQHPATSPACTQRGRWRTDIQAPSAGEAYIGRLARLFLEAGAGDEEAFWLDVAAEAPWDERAIARAGQAVAARFRPNGQYLRSDAGDEVVSIESMAEVSVLFFAARSGSEEGVNAHELKRRGVQHCLTVQRVLCRGDGSVAEEGEFHPETGEFLRQRARRAFRADSCWARGLALATYGFGVAYEMTGERRLLKRAEDHAEFWRMYTPENGVTPWDLDAPMDGRVTLMQRDSSAAAVAAVALLKLARSTHDRVRARGYEDAAMRTVETLIASYLAVDDPEWEGIFKSGVYDIRQDLGVDESVMLGDVFGVEEMLRVLDLL